MITMTVVDFSEIFNFAEKNLGWSWNKCNDQFFNSVIRYREATEIYLSDVESEIEYLKDTSKLEYKNIYQCLVDFMLEHNLTSMLVKS